LLIRGGTRMTRIFWHPRSSVKIRGLFSCLLCVFAALREICLPL
jgi:hypothetical protein